MKKIRFILIALLISAGSFAQNVGINADGSAPDASAMLDVKSTDKGFLPPRVTSTGDITSPATGLLVYQTGGTPGYFYYNGSAWIQIGSASDASQWTTSSSDIYYNSGKVGIATATPGHNLTVQGIGTSNTAVFAMDVTSNGSFNWASSAIAPSLSAGNNIIHMIGQAESANNSGYIGFNFAANGSNNNFLTFGLFGNDNLMNLTGAGNVGIGTTTPSSKLDVNGDIACSAFKADYTITFTINDTYSSGTWFNVIPAGALTEYATYVISFFYTNNSFGPPYYLQASTTITTTSSNNIGTGNEVILPTSSHVGGSNYSIAVRSRMELGNISTGLDVQLNLDSANSQSGETITVKAKRIF